MILTGPEIEKEVGLDRIRIEPWIPRHVGPNSVDLRLHPELRVYDLEGGTLDMKKGTATRDLLIPSEGLVLQPGTLYLGRTVEVVGTNHYVAILEGRSSVGRLGIKSHFTAGFGDVGFCGSWTLEIEVVYPVRVYPNVRICQVSFTVPRGDIRLYSGRYQGQIEATSSRFHVQDARDEAPASPTWPPSE